MFRYFERRKSIKFVLVTPLEMEAKPESTVRFGVQRSDKCSRFQDEGLFTLNRTAAPVVPVVLLLVWRASRMLDRFSYDIQTDDLSPGLITFERPQSPGVGCIFHAGNWTLAIDWL